MSKMRIKLFNKILYSKAIADNCRFLDVYKRQDVLIPPDVTPQRQSFTYANEADVLNVALFGITSKEWRQTCLLYTSRCV